MDVHYDLFSSEMFGDAVVLLIIFRLADQQRVTLLYSPNSRERQLGVSMSLTKCHTLVTHGRPMEIHRYAHYIIH